MIRIYAALALSGVVIGLSISLGMGLGFWLVTR